MESKVPNSSPLFTLTISQAESLFKTWFTEAQKAIEPPVNATPVFYNRYEVSKMLGLCLPTIDRHVREGRLKVKRIGNRYLFSKEDIENALSDPKFRKYIRRT